MSDCGDLIRRSGCTAASESPATLPVFSARMSAAQAARLAADPAVAYVQQDAKVTLAGGTEYRPPSWGLDRIGQRSLPLTGSYSYPDVASGGHAHVLDTGIRVGHVDLGGPAR